MRETRSPLAAIIWHCLHNKTIVGAITCALIVWGLVVAPFDWRIPGFPRDPIPVDAIPDIGENQQIVFTSWPGRSPQDVDDQITYPLTVSLLGIPGVKTIRSVSSFGYSSIYVILREDIDFYWSRSRILERLSGLPEATLPAGVTPNLGPDATALGQIYWYTLEGLDESGSPTGGWSLQERRSIQDWYVRYALQSVHGVSEVASIGGFVKEYQVDVDPDAMRAYGISLASVIDAVRNSNIDVGARTIEVNRVEYVIRGLGFIRSIKDLENTVISSSKNSHIPVRIRDVAHVAVGPALRRGALDKDGVETVGGVVTARFGENPLAAIQNLKAKIDEISPGLPQKKLEDGRISKLTVVPFYDRSDLIRETLGTLSSAIREEILVTVIMIGTMLLHFSSSLLVSCLLPLSVLICFIFMRYFGVDANIVALSGIAIAIGTIDDMGIVMCENILSHLRNDDNRKSRLQAIYSASVEVGGAVTTAVLTTVLGFLPLFAMEGPEGKLFRPLAFTKTFTLVAAILVSLTIIPPAAHVLFQSEDSQDKFSTWLGALLVPAGILACFALPVLGSAIICLGFINIFRSQISRFTGKYFRGQQFVSRYLILPLVLLVSLYYLTESWRPFGFDISFTANYICVGALLWLSLYGFMTCIKIYPTVLRQCLRHKLVFLSIPSAIVIWGFYIWQHTGKEFMPSLDEGSFLYMPTTMPHASIGEALEQLQALDLAISEIPEVDGAIGKLGRASSALDPAPISMFETIVNYKSEYLVDKDGRILKFAYDEDKQEFLRDARDQLIPDWRGKPVRQWREQIRDTNDIWAEIAAKSLLPGLTSAPKLQPIAARMVMLQSGMRAPLGIKIKGPSLQAIESVGLELEKILKEVPSIDPQTVVADRIVAKPYLEIAIDRKEIGRYGLSIKSVQDIIEVAIGGKPLTTTVEGRERYPVRIRYPRELRGTLEDLENILIPTPLGPQIPLGEIAKITFSRQAQAIKSEDTFLTAYVLFDKKKHAAEVDAVSDAQKVIQQKLAIGELTLPQGVSFSFAGSYENQVRSEQRLAIVLPAALFCIFIVTYMNFGSVIVSLLVFSGVFVAWAGGFIMLWLVGQDWFLNFEVFGDNLRHVFQLREYNLSIAVWVGFLALFGIATDDGVLIATYIGQTLKKVQPQTIQEIHDAILEAGKRRVRPALLSTATTLFALLPVLTSRGRGSDIMVPMAIPSFGGLTIALITILVVPVLYCGVEEVKFKMRNSSLQLGFWQK
jgi:Cu(I)/Ag(I) efflux system membrane protein CusA/SilA